ncbi:MAG: DUF2284 domain-containing protein [Clostridia bacterium]|nr:DUF2284 domain-containing protein [Clostridia bacterium]
MDVFDPVAAALACGATKATRLSPSQIITDPAYFAVCRSNGCGSFGQCWNCPPYERPDPENAASLSLYPNALLWQTIGELEDSFDLEGMTEAKRRHQATAYALRSLFRARGIDALHLGCGGCCFCERCARLDGQPCRHPQGPMPAMEGYGVDVYRTTRQTDLLYINGSDTVTYFGLVCYGR